jgi:hypothetical protein
MTPKEKAQDLYFAMINAGKGLTSSFLAKQCALIAVEELCTEFFSLAAPQHIKDEKFEYWKEVKQEIEKL